MLWRFTTVTTGITTLDSDETDEILNTAQASLVNSYSDWPIPARMPPTFKED